MLDIRGLKLEIGGVEILRGIDLRVGKGETVGIIGPNGSGKTTLFNCISGFHATSSGEVFFKGTDVTATEAYERARMGIGRVFQNSGIFREMTVLENLLTAAEGGSGFWNSLFGFVAKSEVERARDALAGVKLDGRIGARASSLSGGQLRLLEIVRALYFGAELLLLDEPTAGVSPKMKEEVVELMRHVRAQGKSILVCEHDINFIQKFCDRIVVLESGRVILDGPPAEVRSSKLLQEIYFGT